MKAQLEYTTLDGVPSGKQSGAFTPFELYKRLQTDAGKVDRVFVTVHLQNGVTIRGLILDVRSTLTWLRHGPFE